MERTVTWLDPTLLTPPHRINPHEPQFLKLVNCFRESGWDAGEPALIGYKHNFGYQLLSGSHRLEAAITAGLSKVPVVLIPHTRVRYAWGDLEEWKKVMQEIPAGEMK